MAGLEHVVVTVPEVKINFASARIGRERLFVLGGCPFPVRSGIESVGILVGLLRRQGAPGVFPAARCSQAEAQQRPAGKRRHLSHSDHAPLGDSARISWLPLRVKLSITMEIRTRLS